MQLSRLDIYNFRKLKECQITISDETTIFVGANNSGKTSAMFCLMNFLGKENLFTPYDFTLSNWKKINCIGEKWENTDDDNPKTAEVLLLEWNSLLPQLDVWIDVSDKELHHVSKILPSLDWAGGHLGVRLRYEPRDILTLYEDYRERRERLKQLDAKNVKLWPTSLLDFLKKDGKLSKYFEIKAYILPSDFYKKRELEDGSLTNHPLDFKPFEGLIKVDMINAQRGFGDTNNQDTGYKSLSDQLREYYEKHLSSDEFLEQADVDVLEVTQEAQNAFDDKLETRFKGAFDELQSLNYPTFGSPNINISSKLKPMEGLSHDSAVLFDLIGKEADKLLKLTERHNGLGYQNLISMTFKLMLFRDSWMKVGKAGLIHRDKSFEPLHLVLIEEPEAHLHAQVQQVFIKKAYERLRNHDELRDKTNFRTQMIVSTHSNHIVEEVEFSSLRYFKRGASSESIPISSVVDLSYVFGKKNDSNRFSKRYLKLTHADLFFADAVILVEGQAERLLVPQFIKEHHRSLDWAYISLLEIGGSHAHRLKPLIEELGIITLIIADIDAVSSQDKRTKEQVERQKNLCTRNATLKTWIPQEENLDKLLDLEKSKKEHKHVRVAYQSPKKVKLKTKIVEVLPNTFEDALIFESENFIIIKNYEEDTSIKRISQLLQKGTEVEMVNSVFLEISKQSFPKAEFALDLLYLDGLYPPQYINEGLIWLDKTLKKSQLNIEKK